MVRRASLAHHACSIAKTLDIVGDPWTLLIVRDSLLGVTRFGEFVTRLGIPRATLTDRLERLCAHDVLRREPDGDDTRHHEYHLTVKGAALRPVILTLMQWGDQWVRDDEPPTRLVEAGTGRIIEPVLADPVTRRTLAELDVVLDSPLLVRPRPSRRGRPVDG
jgi:DNA-binding HxlR family transcriptional regulator